MQARRFPRRRGNLVVPNRRTSIVGPSRYPSPPLPSPLTPGISLTLHTSACLPPSSVCIRFVYRASTSPSTVVLPSKSGFRSRKLEISSFWKKLSKLLGSVVWMFECVYLRGKFWCRILFRIRVLDSFNFILEFLGFRVFGFDVVWIVGSLDWNSVELQDYLWLFKYLFCWIDLSFRAFDWNTFESWDLWMFKYLGSILLYCILLFYIRIFEF